MFAESFATLCPDGYGYVKEISGESMQGSEYKFSLSTTICWILFVVHITAPPARNPALTYDYCLDVAFCPNLLTTKVGSCVCVCLSLYMSVFVRPLKQKRLELSTSNLVDTQGRPSACFHAEVKRSQIAYKSRGY